MGQFPAVFSACRYCAWTYGQASREALPRGASRCATEGRASRPESPVALGAPSQPVAKQVHREHLPALCVYGCGAPGAEIGMWCTATPNLARRACPPVRHFGENPFNYREARWLAQVVSILGADVWGVWRRCGKRVGTCATGGRRRPICGAGPPSKNTPAPRKPGISAGVPGIGALPQPEIRGAYQYAPEAPIRPNPMLRQPKLPRGASRCATEGRATGVVMRCEFRVGEIRRSPRRTMEKPN